ncbi:MAG: flagellar basal-body rod protein FlgB [Rhodospirillaceae bacterium]|nr:MAG: flagellar basal-body rod protein FlgB [Rhodospirillaceae bacterium]
MDLTNLTLFNMAKRHIDWMAQREQVLATNVANADTPDFQPSDVRPLDFQKLLRAQAPMAAIARNGPGRRNASRPHPRHHSGAGAVSR